MERTLVLHPVQDAYLDSIYNDRKLSGTGLYFLGFFKKSIKYRILMKFDMNTIPKGSSIIEATLKLYCTRNDCMDKDSIFNVHPIIEEWDVENVNYANQPAFDYSKKAQTKVDCALWEHINFDITGFVRKWLQKPQENFGIVIKAENEFNEESLLGIPGENQEYLDWRPRIEIKVSTPNKRADASGPPSIAIVTPQFFQPDGNRCLFGGGERYLIDLAQLLQRLGYQVDVFQPTNVGYWERSYEGVRIFGICERGFDRDFFIELNKKFFEAAKDYDFHIYLNMDVTYPYMFPGSICISHGVWWDSIERSWWRSELWYERMFMGLSSTDVLVSVDTNTINWINAVKPDLKCKKVYIPNYVDLNVFKPDRLNYYNKDYIRVLYPRRLYPGRGWSLCKELSVELTEEYENLIFSFVGRADSELTEEHMRIFSSKHPRVEYTWYEMNEMYRAYQGADIVLIPSLCSEGTSLSLLEAMACGKPIIAGLVGGLTDLVFPEYNGYLIEINKENLKNAIVKLIGNPELRRAMGRNARAVSEKFSKEIWEERWEKVILEQFPI